MNLREQVERQIDASQEDPEAEGWDTREVAAQVGQVIASALIEDSDWWTAEDERRNTEYDGPGRLSSLLAEIAEPLVDETLRERGLI